MNAFLSCIIFLSSIFLFPLYGDDNDKNDAKRAISFKWGGRLGDQLMDYAHAKWLSYQWNIPLLLKPFEYSDQFVFDDVEQHLTDEIQSQYNEIHLNSLDPLKSDEQSNLLYVLLHAEDSYDEWMFNGSDRFFVQVDWSDSYFRQMMQSLIAPKKELKLLEIPSTMISVALHYRTGGGYEYDTGPMKQSLPLRFPEQDYYFSELSHLHQLVNQEPIYVYIFTDSPNPLKIKHRFEKKFRNKNIHFDCRMNGNHHDANVLEDLFSMMQFDCMIRPMSHFSMTACHLTDYKIEIYPTHGVWINNTFSVDRVTTIQRERWSPVKKAWEPMSFF